jgi:hypothetical protein
MNEINDGILKVSTTATEFSYAAWIFFREDARRSSLCSIPAVEDRPAEFTGNLTP